MKADTKDILQRNEAHLNKLSNRLTEELEAIVNGSIGLMKHVDAADVRSLDIEVFTDGYRLVLYPMDGAGTQLGYKSLFSEYKDGLLVDEELNVNLDLYDFTNEDDNKALHAFDMAQEKIFTAWFISCFSKVNRSKTQLPFYLSFHHTGALYDLNSNRWIREA